MIEEEDKSEVITKKSSFVNKILKGVLFLILLLTIFFISLIVLSQFKFFRHFALEQILSFANNNLIAKIEAEDLTFWSAEGIKIYGARLITDGDTLAYVPELILNINYELLLEQKVTVNRLILNQPDIRLLRNSKDSIWNYDKIAFPSQDTSTGPSNWSIILKKLEMNNAKFLYYDSTISYINHGTMDYSHIKLDGFDLHLSGIALLNKNDFSVDIFKLKAFETYSQIDLEFEGKLGVNEKIIYAKDIITGINNSNFDIQAEITNYNVFDTINTPEISEAKFKLEFKGYNINDDMIYKFAVIPISFGTYADLLIDAKGTLNIIEIERLNLITGESNVRITGKVSNVLDMDKFEYECSLDNSIFTRKDIISTMASLDLSSIPNFKNAKADRLYVKGYVDSVYSDLSLRTDIGSLAGKMGINFKYEDLRYFADVNLENLNLEPIIRNNLYKSNLNGRVYFKGSGIDIAGLNATFESQLTESEIFDVKFNNLKTSFISNNDTVKIDLFKLGFNRSDETSYLNSDSMDDPHISLVGSLDLHNINDPAYNFDIELNSMNLMKIFSTKSFPDQVTASIQINMKGIHLDSLDGNFDAQINELGFLDRAFLPFSLKAGFIKVGETGKEISLSTDFFKISIDGDFKFSNLVENLINQGNFIADFVQEKFDSFNPNKMIKTDFLNSFDIQPKNYNFPEVNARFHADISDLSPLNIFLDSISVYTQLNLECQIMSNDQFSNFIIDSLQIDYFDFQSPGFQLKTDSIKFDGKVTTSFSDSIPFLERLIINLDKNSEMRINDIQLSNLFSYISYDGSLLNYQIGSTVNKDIIFSSKGNFEIDKSSLQLYSDSLTVTYKNLFKWQNDLPIIINTTEKSISVEQFSMFRDSAEKITLSGLIDDDVAKNLNLQILGAPFTDFLSLTDEETRKKYDGSNLFMDSLRIRINGNLKTPKIITSIFADSVVFNNYKLGTISGRLIHNETYMHGFFDILSQDLANKKILGIDVNYLPIYLGTNPDIPTIDKNKSFDIRLKAIGMPLELIEPFTVSIGLKDLTGNTDATIIVEGNLNDGISYKGNATSTNARVKIINTNLDYNAELNIDFNKDKITLTKVNLRNVDEDSRFGRIGKASATGYIDMNGFEVGYLNISATADRLLVMSDATMVQMPDLYGDFIISTDFNPLKFYGTLDEPNLVGDANIIYGHLKMPMETKKQSVRTYFTYQTIGDKVRIQSVSSKDSLDVSELLIEETNNEVERLKTSIADLINYNLTAKILGQFIVEMDMNLIGSMYAVIATPDRSLPLRYEKQREWSNGKLFGEVIVKEQSTIKSWKQFSTYGKINFPTGSIENPSLDLSATHTGTMVENTQRKQYIVKMYITGFKENPQVRFTYFIDGVEAAGPQDQINEDALYLLVVGRTKTGTSSGSTNSNLLNEGFASGVSNFATKALSDLLMGTGVINSAEFDFQGGSMNLGEATLRLSGQLYGGISWTIGGTVADLSSNNQITIDIPASEFLNNPFWSNFVLQLSKASSNNVMANSQEAKNWEIKIKLGSSW